jgi:hypothetical protein
LTTVNIILKKKSSPVVGALAERKLNDQTADLLISVRIWDLSGNNVVNVSWCWIFA